MLPKGMIEIRLKYVREQMADVNHKLESAMDEQRVTLLKLWNAWKVAEHELMLMLGDPDIRDDWLEEGMKEHLGKANRGELETDPDKIYKRYLREFGSDNSWYAQIVCSWIHIANHNTMPLPKDEKTFFKAYGTITKIKKQIDRRNEGYYDCLGCRDEKYKYEDGYNKIAGEEYCDECAKKVGSEACSGCGLTSYCDCKDGDVNTATGGITEDQYIEALKIYLDIAYPDDKQIWTTSNGKRKIIDLETPESKRNSILRSASKDLHRKVFFEDGIPPSMRFGSWIQPHMKLRYDDNHLWVESNEDSVDGENACELSREVKHSIEHAWQELDWMPTIDISLHYREETESDETLCCILLAEARHTITTTEISKVDCSHCRKILIHKGLMFSNRTKRDCQKCLHTHQQSERTGEPLGCTKAGCGCKDYDDGE